MCLIVTSKSLFKNTRLSDLRQITAPLWALFPQNLLSSWCWQELKLLGPKRKKGFPRWLRGKEHACNAGDTGDAGLIPGSGRSPGGGAWQLIPVFLPGEFHGQRRLVGYGLYDCKESDMTEATEHEKKKENKVFLLKLSQSISLVTFIYSGWLQWAIYLENVSSKPLLP